MPDGIIGLIIFIIIINVGSRLIRALSQPKKTQRPRRPRVKIPPRPGEVKDQPETVFYDEAKIAKIRESQRVRPKPEPKSPVEELLRGVFGQEGGEEPGTTWREDEFEVSREAPGIEGERVPEREGIPSKAEIEQPPGAYAIPGPRKLNRKAYKVAGPRRLHEKAYQVEGVRYLHRRAYAKRAEMDRITYEDINETVTDRASIRQALVLSEILGPCRARKRFRSGGHR
jgi:hypothetical protein